MRIMITGAAGFLGSHLAIHHLKQGDDVLGIDDHSSSLGPNSPHMQRLARYPKFEFVEQNIASEKFAGLVHTFIYQKPDIIYNFACPASPPGYMSMPIHTTMTCVVGMKNMLDIARFSGARLIQASTSEVYGDPVQSPQSESYRGNVNSYGPRACYDEGKRAAEALCYDYKHGLGVDARVIRIFNTYGPHMDPADGRVVSNFIVQALTGKPITIYGDGMQTRSFCYVDDLIVGITAIAMLDGYGGPMNLGNDREFTIMELAEEVLRQIVDTDSFLEAAPMPIDDPAQRCPDLAIARARIDYEPKVHLTEGLEKTIKYFRDVI